MSLRGPAATSESAPADFLTTLHLPLRTEWMRRAEVVDTERFASSTGYLRELLRTTARHRLVVLNGSRHREQLAAAAIALRYPSRRLVIADCTWEVGSNLLDRAASRAGVRAIDRGAVTYCVLSSDETRAFPHNWGVNPSRVVFTPWCYTLSDEELMTPVTDEGFVFAGGDSMRDYGPLLEASRGLDGPVRIAATRSISPQSPGIPANVTVERATHPRFVELTASASVVVVALEAREDRSAGQGTYLNAMALGKPVIVTDVFGARDYIDDRKTGLLVPARDPGAMRAALDWILADENRAAVREIGARAQEAARNRFGPEAYVNSLLRTVDAVLEQ